MGIILCGFFVNFVGATVSVIYWSSGRVAGANGASIHSCEAVKAFLRERPGRVHLERLPGYSPELNPTELVWSQIKRSLKNRVFVSQEDLTAAVLEQISLLEKNRKLVRAFFYKKEVAFFTD